MKTVTIEIDLEGNASVDLNGFHGNGCAEVMDDFTDGAGQVTNSRTKREFNERAETTRQKGLVTR